MSSADTTLRNDTAAAPARAVTNGGGRLGVLAEITATLDEAPESLEALQSVARGALTATASDAVRIVILPADHGGEVLSASEGSALDRGGPRLDFSLSTDAGPLGEVTLARAPGRQQYSESDSLFARTVVAHICDAISEQRAKRHAPTREAPGKRLTDRLRRRAR